MRYLLTAEEMKKCDAFAINTLKQPSTVLMENAARAVEKEVLGCSDLQNTVIAVGSGNNGGDGLALAIMLKEKQLPVKILCLSDKKKYTPEALHFFEKALSLDIPLCSPSEIERATVIVDAMLGIGLTREVQGKYLDAIHRINENSFARVISVDIPSGIHADSGQVMGAAVKADVTVTMAQLKIGLLLYPARAYAGKIIIADIGIPIAGIEQPKFLTYEQSDIKAMLPKRKPDGHKGTFGKVLVVGSTVNMAGAAYLAAKAAFRTGCGMVKIYTHEKNRVIMQTLLPEAMLETYGVFDEATLRKALEWADSIAVGCGMGDGETEKSIVQFVLEHTKKPLVLDADALNIIAEKGLINSCKNAVITPHPVEMARLSGMPTADILSAHASTARAFAERNNLICVLKGAATAVSDGSTVIINNAGNSGMATAGSGDVLTGVIASLLAQGMTRFSAASLGVYIHALAGDAAKEALGEHAVMASDIADNAEAVIKKIIGLMKDASE